MEERDRRTRSDDRVNRLRRRERTHGDEIAAREDLIRPFRQDDGPGIQVLVRKTTDLRVPNQLTLRIQDALFIAVQRHGDPVQREKDDEPGCDERSSFRKRARIFHEKRNPECHEGRERQHVPQERIRERRAPADVVRVHRLAVHEEKDADSPTGDEYERPRERVTTASHGDDGSEDRSGEPRAERGTEVRPDVAPHHAGMETEGKGNVGNRDPFSKGEARKRAPRGGTRPRGRGYVWYGSHKPPRQTIVVTTHSTNMRRHVVLLIQIAHAIHGNSHNASVGRIVSARPSVSPPITTDHGPRTTEAARTLQSPNATTGRLGNNPLFAYSRIVGNVR